MPYMSTIANNLLFSPFDIKAEVDREIAALLTTQEFLKYCYSEPQFIQKKVKSDEEEYVGDSDYVLLFSELQNLWYKQEQSSKSFHNWLKNEQADGVYTICGNAGTGKTTFVNYLKETSSDGLYWIVLNMSNASNMISWLGDNVTIVTDFHFAYKKMIASILEFMRNELFVHDVDTEDAYCQKVMFNINTLINNYKLYFASSIKSRSKFFDDLITKVDLCKNHVECITAVAEYFVQFFKHLFSCGNYQEEFTRVLDIFLIFIRCISEDINRRSVIVFDDLERFIGDNELHSEEVDDIRKQLSSYAKSINMPGNRNKDLFKFIMVVRNKTARMIGVRLQSADNMAKNVDIGEWFDIDDIIERKYKWFQSHGFTVENIELMRQIVGDFKICRDGKITGLQQFISTLFNNNMRLVIDFIGIMLERPGYKTYVSLYKEYWNKSLEPGKGFNINRFAARSLVRALMLKCLEDEDSLFQHLKTFSISNSKGLDITRKILTVLNNCLVNDKKDIGLNDLISQIANVNDVSDYYKSDNSYINTISEVLFYMNSYNRRNNDWIQFIDMQIKKAQEKIEIRTIDELTNLIYKSNDRISLNIMPAGQAYLRDIVASFEFFFVKIHKIL